MKKIKMFKLLIKVAKLILKINLRSYTAVAQKVLTFKCTSSSCRSLLNECDEFESNVKHC